MADHKLYRRIFAMDGNKSPQNAFVKVCALAAFAAICCLIFSSCARVSTNNTQGGYTPFSLSPLSSIPVLKDYQTMRSSSQDRMGNADFKIIGAGETLVIADLQGPGEITHIWVTISSEDPKHLRNIAMRVYYDGNDFPSVESPIGDFFGLGHGAYYYYGSAVQSIGTDNAMNSFWPMPFQKSARIEATNESTIPVKAFYYYVDWRLFRAMPPNMGYFHAQYRQEFPCQTGKNYCFLETSGGVGHFMGVNLSVHTQVSGWWGEGDDIFTIDGEQIPSIWGTGSEDYFCGAWCYGNTFYYPFFGMPYRKNLNQSQNNYWNVYRYHIENPIAFSKSLKAEIEHGALGFDNTRKGGRNNDYSSVAYWYMEKPVRLVGSLPPAGERSPVYKENILPDGLFELQYFDISSNPPGIVDVQDLDFFITPNRRWLNNDHLFCNHNTSDSVVQIRWNTDKVYTGEMILVMTQAPDYGIISLSLDGEDLLPNFNGYAAVVQPALVNLGNRTLKAGNHTLVIQTRGRDERSIRYLWGIDYMRIGGDAPEIEKDMVVIPIEGANP